MFINCLNTKEAVKKVSNNLQPDRKNDNRKFKHSFHQLSHIPDDILIAVKLTFKIASSSATQARRETVNTLNNLLFNFFQNLNCSP